MKETTVVWAKLFLILIISAKPLGLKAVDECNDLDNNLCLNHSECCSGYCFMEPGWEHGVCKQMNSPEKSTESNNGKNTVKNNEKKVETGVCAYYKGEYITANGDAFDENEMTAAHQTLPFDTMVKVETTMGTSVVVKINDRKTSSDGRVMLLSRAAAKSLNIDEHTGPVQCQLKIMTALDCIRDLTDTCVLHHECCSQNCFRQIFSEVGYCLSK